MSTEEEVAATETPPSGPQEKPPLGNLDRILAGLLGGLFALIAKYLGQDHAEVLRAYAARNAEELELYLIGYAICAPLLMLLGGGLAWVTEDERSRLKLLAIGVAAPALITTWIGGAHSNFLDTKSKTAMHDSAPLVQHALYLGDDRSARIWRAAVDDWPEVHRESKALRGIKRFLNIYEIRHWVVIASFGRRNDAVRFADEVRDLPPTRQVYVGITGPWNQNYPVFAAPGEPLEDAERRLAAVKGIPAIRRNQPYLSAY